MGLAANPLRYFHSLPDVVRLVVMKCMRLSWNLRYGEDLLFARGSDTCPDMMQFYCNRFGSIFASDFR